MMLDGRTIAIMVARRSTGKAKDMPTLFVPTHYSYAEFDGENSPVTADAVAEHGLRIPGTQRTDV